MSSSEYYTQLIALQAQLYAYVLTLLADTSAADDVLQETNLVLCRKADEFAPGTNFEAWAFGVARMQCMAYWKTRSRDKLVLSDEAVHRIAGRAEVQLTEADDRRIALRDCMEKLTPKQRDLVECRYAEGGSIRQMALDLGRSEASLSQTLYRIRITLLDCVRARLSGEGKEGDEQ